MATTWPSGDAWTVAKGLDLASFSAAVAARAPTWTGARSREFAVQSRRAAASAAVSIAAKPRAAARDLHSGTSARWSWIRAKSRDFFLELRHAFSMTSLWVRGTAGDAAVRLPTLSYAARRAALRQSERAALLAVRMRAQILAESDALSRAWRSVIPVRR
jgi:hypothetical protein